MQTVPVPVGIGGAHNNLHPRLLCSKCGLYGFTSLNDLETHIVKKHFRVNALLKCCFQKCVARFATDVDRLEHLHLKQHDTKLKKVIQMEDEHFVWLRLAISDLLNESINMSLLRLTGLDAKNFQGPRKSQGPEVRRNLSAKRANITQNERRDGMETNARQRSAQTSLERRPQRQQNLTKPRTLSNAAINLDRLYQPEGVTCSKGASSSDLRMEISEPNNENNMRNEPENSSRSCVVKVGQRLINVLVTPDPAISSNNPNKKGIERPDYDTSSEQSVMKDELSLFDELADAVPTSSDHSDYLTFGNIEPSASKPANPRMENLSDRNNEHKRSEHENSVVKDEPSVIEESVSTYQNNRSDHGDYVTLTNNEPTASRKPEKQRLVNLPHRNNEHRRSEHGNCVVKDEPSLIDEMAVTIPGPSNHLNSNKQQTNSEGANPLRYSENLPSERAEHENSVVKDEPSLIDELSAAAIPAALNDSFTPSNNELTVLSSKPKRSRKQNLYDVDADVSQLQTSMSQAVVKDEPSLIDDLASMIPGPSNHGNNLDPSNNVTATDSDDEIRIVTEPPAPKRPRPPNSGKKVGTKRLTTPQMQAIVRANELGTEKSDIAKIFDTSMWSVNRVLNEYRCQERTVHDNSIVKEEPSLSDELAAMFPSSSNLDDCLIRSNNERTVHDNPVVKDEPSLIDELAEMIPAPSNLDDYLIRSSNVIGTDSNDEVRIVTAPKLLRAPNSGAKVGKKCLTVSQKLAIVRANERETKPSDIAKIFDTSIETVRRVLAQYRSEARLLDSGAKVGTKCLTAPQMQAIVRANEQGTEKSVIAKIFDTSIETVDRVLSERTLPQSSSRPPVVEDETSFLDELASLIPGPSNHELPNTKRLRVQNQCVLEDDDDRDSLRIQEDDRKGILPKKRKQKTKYTYTPPSIRRAVVNASNEGLSSRQIANMFDINKDTVAALLKRWKTHGTTERKPYPVQEVNKAVEQFVLDLVKEDRFKSGPEIKSEILKKFNLTVSRHTVQKILSHYKMLKCSTEKDLSQSESS